MKRRVLLLIIALCSFTAAAQELPGGGAEGPHSAGSLYRQLRSVGLDRNRLYRVRDAHVDREDLHLSFDRGVIAFTQTIDGRVTGAFFEGTGEILVSPPDRVERASMGLFAGSAILNEEFKTAYLRFNDDTVRELEPALRPFEVLPPLPPDPGAPVTKDAEPELDSEDSDQVDPEAFITRGTSVFSALAHIAALRLLTTFIDAETVFPDGSIRWEQPPNDRYLHARLGNTKFGVFDVFFDSRVSEQIMVGQRNDVGGIGYFDVWTSFPMRSARMRVTATRSGAPPTLTAQTQAAAEAVDDPVHISHYKIQAKVQPPHQLRAETTLDLQTSQPDSRIVLFELSRYLKVEKVTVDGQPADFVQNEALEGSALARRGNDLIAVVFPSRLTPGRSVRVRFVYGGDVLSEAGGGLMYVGARGIWYPNRGLAMSDFDLEFRYPAGWTLVATGKRVAPPAEVRSYEGPQEQVVRYTSERPIPLAGFNLGRYVTAEAKAGHVQVDTYAAGGVEDSMPRPRGTIVAEPQDPFVTRRQPAPIQILPAPEPKPSAHGQKLARNTADAIDFLSARLGPFPYSSLAMTQMPGPSSQSWPGLVFLSSMAFLSPEERVRMHVGPYGEVVYGRTMPAHETAHQWWGDLLIWKSYREQWLVEALSEYCVLLRLEQQDPTSFRLVMDHYRHDLLQQNKNGRAMTEAGPVTLGARLDSSQFPQAYDIIAYGRGTWLFHMLHHMLLDATVTSSRPASPGRRARNAAEVEDPFFAVLRGLRQRFEGKEINTRDVQQAFEDVLPDSLRYEGHKSLEWFFDGWVNGTAIPSLHMDGVKLTRRGTSVVATGRVIQKDAPVDLVTSVPLYAELPASKKLVLLGRIFAEGSETPFRFTVPPETRRILLDPLGTVLSRP